MSGPKPWGIPAFTDQVEETELCTNVEMGGEPETAAFGDCENLPEGRGGLPVSGL